MAHERATGDCGDVIHTSSTLSPEVAGILYYLEKGALRLARRHTAATSTTASDIFSLAVAIYDLLRGDLPPFMLAAYGIEPGEWGTLRHYEAMLRRAPDLRCLDALPRALAEWLRACFALRPEARPTAAQLLAAAPTLELRLAAEVAALARAEAGTAEGRVAWAEEAALRAEEKIAQAEQALAQSSTLEEAQATEAIVSQAAELLAYRVAAAAMSLSSADVAYVAAKCATDVVLSALHGLKASAPQALAAARAEDAPGGRLRLRPVGRHLHSDTVELLEAKRAHLAAVEVQREMKARLTEAKALHERALERAFFAPLEVVSRAAALLPREALPGYTGPVHGAAASKAASMGEPGSGEAAAAQGGLLPHCAALGALGYLHVHVEAASEASTEGMASNAGPGSASAQSCDSLPDASSSTSQRCCNEPDAVADLLAPEKASEPGSRIASMVTVTAASSGSGTDRGSIASSHGLQSAAGSTASADSSDEQDAAAALPAAAFCPVPSTSTTGTGTAKIGGAASSSSTLAATNSLDAPPSSPDAHAWSKAPGRLTPEPGSEAAANDWLLAVHPAAGDEHPAKGRTPRTQARGPTGLAPVLPCERPEGRPVLKERITTAEAAAAASTAAAPARAAAAAPAAKVRAAIAAAFKEAKAGVRHAAHRVAGALAPLRHEMRVFRRRHAAA